MRIPANAILHIIAASLSDVDPFDIDGTDETPYALVHPGVCLFARLDEVASLIQPRHTRTSYAAPWA